MSVRLRVAPPPHLWTVVKKMHLKSGKAVAARHRPDTATLDKPLILDPGLLRKVDMTRLTREQLLTIENLIATPKKTRNSHKSMEKQGKVIPRSKSRDDKIDSWEDEESSAVDDYKFRNNSRVINTTFRVRSHVRKGLREVFEPHSQISPPTRKDVTKGKSPKENHQVSRERNNVEDVFGTLIVGNHHVPSPCSTCGRSERPERLHAHPSVPQHKRSKLKEDQENTVVVVQQKSSVTKPVAMKFRSGKTRAEKHPAVEKVVTGPLKSPGQNETKEQRKTMPLIRRETFKIERGSKPMLSVDKKTSTPSPSPTRKSSLLVHPPPRRQALPRTPDKQPPKAVSPVPPPLPVPTNPVVHSASPRRPRTITCYLCQKQFGTASYPLHEPQCLQKWHRENQSLPTSQQQPEPQRPSSHGDGWDHAWEAAQAAMVACDGCSKTFLPHRLEAHRRVCQQSPVKKPPPPKQESESAWEDHSERSERSDRSVQDGPASFHCHICGRIFNKAAIDHHEQQCLKRWQLQHSRDSSSSAATPSTSPPSSAQSTPRRRLVLCYLCGRQFGTASIAIHEPQCLRKWRQENERLPPGQRRSEPHKPEQVYDEVTGQVDYQATEDAQWQCHLVQLVPCPRCGRTFTPDRVLVHEKCCKVPIKH